MIPQVDTSIAVGMKRSSNASITNFLCRSVDSSHICIPKCWHWFGFIIDFYIIFLNHKPFPKSSIDNSPESSVNEVTPVSIGVFTCFVYSRRNGGTVHYSEANDIGIKFIQNNGYHHDFPFQSLMPSR